MDHSKKFLQPRTMLLHTSHGQREKRCFLFFACCLLPQAIFMLPLDLKPPLVPPLQTQESYTGVSGEQQGMSNHN
jgi:hypothetical protein